MPSSTSKVAKNFKNDTIKCNNWKLMEKFLHSQISTFLNVNFNLRNCINIEIEQN